MGEEQSPYFGYADLPRGGYLVETPSGPIQFGSPPETIKDTMVRDHGVPQVFVLPTNFFSWQKGLSVAELEFPIYFNFFLKQRPTYIICLRKHFEQFKLVLNEALFGPDNPKLEKDYSEEGLKTHAVPDLRKEMSFFRGKMKLSDLVKFGLIDSGKFTINDATIRISENNSYTVSHGGKQLARVPRDILYTPKHGIGAKPDAPFYPPLLGITCLGPSHGFDPNDSTSGFIIWLNHRGIMIDPPANSNEWLIDSNVNPKYIDSIILTHCHADHDAGTFQKILEEGKIRIFTTRTVIDSFLTKYSAFTNVSREYLRKLFNFFPVKIGEPFFIHGAKFEAFYTLHSIPTIGFKMQYQDQSMVYSSDHNNDPEVHKKLFDMNIIDQKRYDQLSNFSWDSNIIYHESGIAPLHTPIAFLNSLPKDTQEKIVVYHIAAKDFPEDTALRLAKFGIENTEIFEMRSPEHEKAHMILQVLQYLDFFDDLSARKAEELLSIAQIEHFKAGDRLIEKGMKGDNFYIIQSGLVKIISEGLKEEKIYGAFDYFGEVALVQNAERSAHVEAVTDLRVISIERYRFLQFIHGTEFGKNLSRLAAIRDAETWNVLSTSLYFQFMTSTQKTALEAMFTKQDIKAGTTLAEKGKKIAGFYIVREGTVELDNGSQKFEIGRGSFVGDPKTIHADEVSELTAVCKTDVKLYLIDGKEMQNFLEKNPGVLMKLVYDIEGLNQH